jgi:short-subunit dehydrogenase
VSLPKPSQSSTALVTGASAGIGGAIAHELAARGHGVVLVARRQDRLEALAEELSGQHGVRAEAIACDLAKDRDRNRLPAQVSELGLEVDVLINNAGFATGGPFHAADPKKEIQQVRLDVEAVVALTSAFLPAMVERRRGAILNVASVAGFQPMPYAAGYSAAKAYVLRFSEAIHQEVRSLGVTVTAVAPPPVETEFWQEAGWEAKGGRSFEQATPGVARLKPEDVARAAVKGLEAGDRVVTPGLAVKLATQAAQYIPHFVKLPALEWYMRPGGDDS